MSEPKIHVLLRTTSYRGDHSADVGIAHEVVPGETVAALVDRLKPDLTDWIELRVVV